MAIAAPDARPDELLDETLLKEAASGRHEAVAALYDRYRSDAYAVALRITGRPSDAQDAMQDAFLAVWRSAGAYAPERGSVAAWLLSIVRHRSIDRIRRRRATEELPDDDAPPPQLVRPDVWPEVAARLDRDAIRAALGALPHTQREAIELAYFGGLTQREIADRTGAPLGTVKGRVRLGLLGLRDALTATEPDRASSQEATSGEHGPSAGQAPFRGQSPMMTEAPEPGPGGRSFP